MSPSRRLPARKTKPKAAAKRVARSSRGKAKPRKKAAPRKAASARKAALPAKPPAPKPWSADIAGLNVVWYTCRDWEAAKRFYGETLGFPVAMADEQMGWVEYGTELPHLAIGKGDPSTPPSIGSGGAIAVLSCPDVRGTMAKLQARGVRCGTIDEIPGAVILGTFFDPEGNKLQLAQTLPR